MSKRTQQLQNGITNQAPARAFVWTPVPLYAPDKQLAQMVLGSEAHRWPLIVRQLEGEGLPSGRALFGDLRYVPAVIRFFDRREGLVGAFNDHSLAEDGPEVF